MRPRNVLCLLVATALTSSIATYVVAQEAGSNETRRIPQFENEHVRVWKSIITPNQPLTMHRHEQPRALIALTGGDMTIVSNTGEERVETWETGRAYWLTADPPGELHADVNKGTENIEVIVVEMNR